MADLIRVDRGQMERLASDAHKLSNALDALKSRISSVRVEKESGADVRIPLSSVRLNSIEQTLRSGTTEECLRGLAANLGSLQFYANALAAGIRSAAEEFEQNERNLTRRFTSLMTPDELMLVVGQAMGYGSSAEGWTSSMHQKIQDMIQNAQILVDEGMTFLVSDSQAFLFDPRGLIGMFTTTIGLSGITATSRIYNGDHRHETKTEIGLMDGGFSYKDSILKPTDLFRDAGQFDKNGNYSEGKPKMGKGIGIFTIGASTAESYSWIGENIAHQDGKVSSEIAAGVGNAETHASIKGGLGAYLPGEGGSELTVGAKADMGVSVSAANVDASMSYELCDQVSVGVGSEVSVLEGEAGVEAGLGYVDGKIMAYGEASAEANLVDAGVEGSVDLGLVEGKVGAGVQVGIGAHAKAGYNDGVVSFDVGASFSVGMSFNAEINIGGALDAVGDVAGSAIQAAADGWDKLSSAIFG